MEVVLYALFVAAWALLWAKLDRKAIDKGKRIFHALRWCLRAGLVIAVAAGVAHRLGNWWSILPLLTMGAFLFSAVFRARLNKLRVLHPCYVSRSNYYDRAFLFYAGVRCGIWRKNVPRAHTDLYEFGGKYTLKVLRAGMLAYITEITLTILSAFVVGWLNA